jgi:hypothetical protein
MPDAAEEFIVGLRRCGATAQRHDGLVLYQIEPVDGRFAGEVVQTAVEVQELTNWPMVPPHWVHLPTDVVFAATNSQPSSLPGWLRHSRQIMGWGGEAEPAQGWLAHVRAVVGEAQ